MTGDGWNCKAVYTGSSPVVASAARRTGAPIRHPEPARPWHRTIWNRNAKGALLGPSNVKTFHQVEKEFSWFVGLLDHLIGDRFASLEASLDG